MASCCIFVRCGDCSDLLSRGRRGCDDVLSRCVVERSGDCSEVLWRGVLGVVKSGGWENEVAVASFWRDWSWGENWLDSGLSAGVVF